MPRVNVYIRNRVWERFALEPQKSGLVNVLLDRHYGESTTSSVRVKALEISRERAESTPEATITKEDAGYIDRLEFNTPPLMARVIATPEQALQAAKALPIQGKQCKNGHSIPDGRSKCMGKGCKYAN